MRTADFAWETTDRFRSNNGRGPDAARILAVHDNLVEMERWNTRAGRRARRVRFVLPVSYWLSSRNGWIKTHLNTEAQ